MKSEAGKACQQKLSSSFFRAELAMTHAHAHTHTHAHAHTHTTHTHTHTHTHTRAHTNTCKDGGGLESAACILERNSKIAIF
jgi:hypothetical protein